MQQRSKVSVTDAQPNLPACCTKSTGRPVCCLCAHMRQCTRVDSLASLLAISPRACRDPAGIADLPQPTCHKC